MSQQYTHFEEDFHGGSQTQQHQPEANGEYTPTQKPSTLKMQKGRENALNLRFSLMIVSIVFTFILFIVAMTRPFSFVTIFFTLLFVSIMILFNILFTMSIGIEPGSMARKQVINPHNDV